MLNNRQLKKNLFTEKLLKTCKENKKSKTATN